MRKEGKASEWVKWLLVLLLLTPRFGVAQVASTLLPLPATARYGQGRLLLKAALKPLLPANTDLIAYTEARRIRGGRHVLVHVC